MKQLEVDFVIPLVNADLPLCIDPFLLYKSRDPELRELHQKIVAHFAHGMSALSAGEQAFAEELFTFPEVAEVGLGYGTSDKQGSGMGKILRRLLIDTLKASPAILSRKMKHVEEMQLVSPGIGPDRISDITSNILKEFLIEYTQRQAGIHGIPIVSGLPIPHVYDSRDNSWRDGYYDLPMNPVDGRAILLVPRRIVRRLPWINYENFLKTEFRAFLESRRKVSSLPIGAPTKSQVTTTSRVETAIIDNYIKQREQMASEAQPYMPSDNAEARGTADLLKNRLAELPVGVADASAYQQLVLDVLTFVFCPDLIDGRLEVRTIDGTERRDIIFTNDSDSSFFDYVRNSHDALTIMFEVKNVSELRMDALNQAGTYLGDRIGRLGFIVTRHAPNENIQRKQMSIFNDSNPRKVLLILSDNDLLELVELRAEMQSPVKWLQKRYRDFRTSVQ